VGFRHRLGGGGAALKRCCIDDLRCHWVVGLRHRGNVATLLGGGGATLRRHCIVGGATRGGGGDAAGAGAAGLRRRCIEDFFVFFCEIAKKNKISCPSS
jgi:hypothetical protein